MTPAEKATLAARVTALMIAATTAIAPFTMQREGRPPAVYMDQGGVHTGGYGHTGADLPALGAPVSQTQADQWLAQDLATAGAHVSRCVDTAVLLEQPINRLGVLSDFTLNVGGHAFCTSRLRDKLNARDPTACAEISRWKYVTVRGKKVVSQGLVNARAKQRAICEGTLQP